MKTTAKAKYGLQIEGVQILAGDTFNVVGTVVAFKGVLVDLTKYADAFEITKENAASEPVVLEVTHDIVLSNGIVIEAGTQFKVVDDIVELNGGIIDIAKYTKFIKVVEAAAEHTEKPTGKPSEEHSVEPSNEHSEEPGKEPGNEPSEEPGKEPGNEPSEEPGNEPEIPSVTD